MKRVILLIVSLMGGMLVARRLLPDRILRSLADLPAAPMRWMMGNMPDE